MPWLYLKGISSGEMGDVLGVLLGQEAKGFSAAVVSRLKAEWEEERAPVDGAGFEQGALGIPVGGWDIQRIA